MMHLARHSALCVFEAVAWPPTSIVRLIRKHIGDEKDMRGWPQGAGKRRAAEHGAERGQKAREGEAIAALGRACGPPRNQLP